MLCSGAAFLHLAQGVLNSKGTLKFQDYQGILEIILLLFPEYDSLISVTGQQYNDSKHLRGKHWTILRWPSMNPDLNPVEHFWMEQKQAAMKAETTGAAFSEASVTITGMV